jgi:8-oxo-dGTP pyrophosphatase MutT (NUDIX family)
MDEKVRRCYKLGVILITQKNQVVVVRNRSSRIWGFPKGSIKRKDRDYFETASRELMEETGIHLIPNIDNSKRIKIGKTYYYVMCVDENVKFDPIDKFEIDKVKLISIHGIISLKKINAGLLKFYKRNPKHKETIIQYADGSNSYTNPR